MPRTLADDLAADANNVFLDAEHFAEWATYTPREGSARRIKIVVRDEQRRREDQTHHRLNQQTLELIAANDATDGIDDPLENETLVRDAQPRVTWSLRRVIALDQGMVSLEFTAATMTQAGRFRPQTL